MQSSSHILVVGSINMDLVVTTPRHPKIGESILGERFQTFPGGKGSNQAVAAARLGSRVKMIGRVGNDPFGDTLRHMIALNGVDDEWISRDSEVPSGVALIIVGEEGDNSIVVVPGANGRLTPEHIFMAEQAFVNASVLLIQLEIPLPSIEAAIELARQHELKIILNPAPYMNLDTRTLAKVDYLIPNETELALLAGVETIDSAVKLLQARGVMNLIVTLGKDGALIVTEKHKELVPAFQVNAVDTTAAGDSFMGAFSVALNEGKSLIEAVRWGNAAGALAATRPGAQPSLPTREELTEFLRFRS